MMLEISRRALDAIRSHAASDPAREVCGLLFGSVQRIEAAEAVINVADNPARRFELDPAALFRAIRAERAGGPPLTGYYHSHPGGCASPSQEDVANAREDGKVWLITSAGQVTAWRLRAGAFEPVVMIES
ncbi:MAG: M67 family metallopeptidase [Proteobacteria bacterium]|nr:M67 family metallopeptidase [Pseudomonadota bacterium]